MSNKVAYDVGSWRLTADGRIFRRGTVRYPNGDLYEGEFVNHRRHGRGALTYASGDKYVGGFEDGQYHGFGILSRADVKLHLTKKWRRGEKYEGNFIHGKKHGKGLLVGPAGSYDGEFENDVPSGTGTYSYKNGVSYTGNWKFGRWHGHGEISDKFGGKYTGSIEMGKPHGFGSYNYGKGNGHYTGSYHRGKRHGHGERVFQSGTRYTGFWVDDEMSGEGVLVRQDATKYVGQFVGGKPSGHGLVVFKDGSSYEGEAKLGFFYGKGKLTYADGGYYDGEFLHSAPNKFDSDRPFPKPDGKRHGFGVRVWSNLNRYEGQWVGGYMEGKAVFTTADGMIYTGDFVRGKMTGTALIRMKHPNGEAFEFPPGSELIHEGPGECFYEGGVFNGCFHGTGHFKYLDGRWYKGVWRYGKRHGQGEQQYIAIRDEGDEERCYIGGNGAMYRIARYVGGFDQDVRHGQGTAFYSNGDSIQGCFNNGHIDGTALYTYSSGKQKWGVWKRGTRVRWFTEEEGVQFEHKERAATRAMNILVK